MAARRKTPRHTRPREPEPVLDAVVVNDETSAPLPDRIASGLCIVLISFWLAQFLGLLIRVLARG